VTHGIHHVTAIAGDPQANLDFYVGVLGLRFVKRTVNFDDPGTYHFYYGDRIGSPGTLLTFFPWAGAQRGRRGPGQAEVTAFAIPAGSLGYWTERLKAHGVAFDGPAARFDEEAVSFLDPDGLALELVARADAAAVTPWSEGPIAAEHEIRGFHSVALAVARSSPTAALLEGVMGYRAVGESGGRRRFVADHAGPGAFVDVVESSDTPAGRMGTGTVHHVAFRAADDAEQAAARDTLLAERMRVTPVQERNYFRSIYFREPGGVLFEIATDPPGMTVDEPVESLGESLKLPPWYERLRPELERHLPKIAVPGSGARA
jgi:glyoxalase family protein